MLKMCRAGATAVAMMLALSAPTEAQINFTPISPDCSANSASWAPTYTSCRGAFAGNDTGTEANRQSVYTYIESTWGLTNVGQAEGVGSFAGTLGTIQFASPHQNFVLALKQSNAFSLYYFDASKGEISQVSYFTDGVQEKETLGNQDLSHWTVYKGDGVSVPEPGTMLLLSTGLLGMAAVRRRREDVA